MPLDTSAPVTRPGYLIEIGFAPVRYFSTRGLQSWSGHTWVSSGWVFSGQQLTLPGGDPSMTQLILSQGVVGRVVRVWLFYGEVATDTNTELTFSGVIDGAPALINDVRLTLFDRAMAIMYAPRQRFRPELGFSVLPQKGLRIDWNNVVIIFKDQPK
jgi:hypothetical protein